MCWNRSTQHEFLLGQKTGVGNWTETGETRKVLKFEHEDKAKQRLA